MLGIGDRKRKLGGGILQHQHQHQQHKRHHQQHPIGGNGQLMQQHGRIPQQQQQPMIMNLMPAIGQAMQPVGALGAAAAVASAATNYGVSNASSCVLFINDIPHNTNELELKRAFQEFGKIEQIVPMPAKHQALVEFLRIADAERAVSMYMSGCQIVANGGNLAVAFSNRSRIDVGQESYQSTAPQNCLLLTFFNVRMEFNCESIRQICSPYGLLDRCLLIRQQDGLLRAVLEFDKLEDAVLTKPNLNGANMYAGCNSIRCEYVKPTAFEYLGSRELVLEEYRYEAYGSGGGAAAASSHHHHHNPQDSTSAAAAVIGLLAKRARLPIGEPQLPGSLHRQQQPQPVGGGAVAADLAASLGAAGLLMQQQLQHHHPGQQQQQHRNQQKQQKKGPIEPVGHHVLVFRGLSPQINCDRLFNILVLYGNVARIKFITSREGFALVQMLDAASAQQAVEFLNGQTVLGSTLKVTHSDQGVLKSGTKEFSLADGSPADKSFEGVKLNRFMSQGAAAKNQQGLGRTCRVLYYWGCPDGTSETAIRDALKLAGAAEPESISTQNEKGSTGWITFASVSDATDAICLANHAAISGEAARLKLSYALNKK